MFNDIYFIFTIDKIIVKPKTTKAPDADKDTNQAFIYRGRGKYNRSYGGHTHKKVESVLSAYDADMGYLIFRVAKPEIVITNIKNRLYSNEKLAAQIKELDNETTVICICDKLESQQYTSNKNIDIVLEEPLEVGVLLDIVKGKTNLLR